MPRSHGGQLARNAQLITNLVHISIDHFIEELDFIAPSMRILPNSQDWKDIIIRVLVDPGYIFPMTQRIFFCSSSMATFSSLVRPTLMMSILASNLYSCSSCLTALTTDAYRGWMSNPLIFPFSSGHA